MTIHKIIKAQKIGKLYPDNLYIQIYQFASAFYARLVDNEGFVYDDNQASSNGSYQDALAFAYKYQLK